MKPNSQSGAALSLHTASCLLSIAAVVLLASANALAQSSVTHTIQTLQGNQRPPPPPVSGNEALLIQQTLQGNQRPPAQGPAAQGPAAQGPSAANIMVDSRLQEANQREAAMQIEAAGHFTVVAPGVVRDNRTGREWMRCALGQVWNDSAKNCTGIPSGYTWQHALDIANKFNATGGYANRSDWRLPNVRELQSLRYCSLGFGLQNSNIQDGNGAVPMACVDGFARPSIAQIVFPSTTFEWHRSSSSPFGGDRNASWAVSFLSSQVGGFYHHSNGVVRLVR